MRPPPAGPPPCSPGCAPRPPDLAARGDADANAAVLAALAEFRPADPVLSEESADDPVRLAADRVWIVDPLDGTREFAAGSPEWAVHVALWERGAGITAAAVALPALGEVHVSGEPAQQHPTRDDLLVAVSASRPPACAAEIAERLGARLVPMGSAGAKAMAVLRGDVDAYVHAGGQWEWDSAAPVGVALAAGLHASRLDGSPLRYNRPSPYLPDLVVCRAELADALTGRAAT
ncbi:3'(2'),5'-bisphosphate nucleotidase CysQ [Actinokineospora soli]|uniref:3'(2'),5'-bisphosphate nucleotidase CysQ n=1 Tax=Actinokineospora soli TaxID=1048753 RepID=A0ABW2TWB4_9PSEU